MQVVARIILRRQLAGDLRVGEKLVEVGNGIKRPRGADEAVDLLSMWLSASISTKQYTERPSMTYLVASLAGSE
jgi:hypothetical protein